MRYRHLLVRPQTYEDAARWRNALVPLWLPPHWTWRIFVAGFVMMLALAVSTVLVWQIVSDEDARDDDRIEQRACEGLADNRMVVRRVIVRLGSLRGVPDAEIEEVLKLAPPIDC